MSSAPIFRIAKIKARGTSRPDTVMGHLTRSRPTPNANEERRHLNVWLVGDPSMDLSAEIRRRLADAGVKPRDDATIAVDFVLTASPDFFRPDPEMGHGEYDATILAAFVEAAAAFMETSFGDRLICAVLHLDETTPHVQGVMMPLMPPNKRKGRRLSAKTCFDREALRLLQTRWEASLAPLGCGSRLERSQAYHVENRRYHSGVAEVAAQVDGLRWRWEPFPPPGPDVATTLETLRAWHSREVDRFRAMIQPLAKAAVFGRMFEESERSVRRLRETCRRAKAKLIELEREKNSRLDLDVPRDEISALLKIPFEKGPVLDQICRIEGLTYGKAARYLACVVGTDATLALLVEAMRPQLDRAIANRRTDEPSEKPAGPGFKT